MIGAKIIQLNNYAPEDGVDCLGSCSGEQSFAIPPTLGNPAVSRERLQLYATHLELMLLRKNSEISDLQRIMEQRVDEMQQKRVEQERIMIHQARHAAMGEMLGTIAHQWRQPLNSISLIFQNLRDAWEYGELDAELFDRSLFKVMEQIMGLSRTIDDFRSFLAPVKSSENFDPIRCVEESVGLMSGWFSYFPVITIHKPDEELPLATISGCPNAFTQVVFNLLTNAGEAVQLRQRLAGADFHGAISIHFQRSGGDIVITIADNGGGIAACAMEHIFKPYFTTKPKANGIGIGLYVAKLIVENSLNGSIWAENVDDGALFSIRLPVSAAEGGGV
jgi:signal transduction histidine kinase